VKEYQKQDDIGPYLCDLLVEVFVSLLCESTFFRGSLIEDAFLREFDKDTAQKPKALQDLSLGSALTMVCKV